MDASGASATLTEAPHHRPRHWSLPHNGKRPEHKCHDLGQIDCIMPGGSLDILRILDCHLKSAIKIIPWLHHLSVALCSYARIALQATIAVVDAGDARKLVGNQVGDVSTWHVWWGKSYYPNLPCEKSHRFGYVVLVLWLREKRGWDKQLSSSLKENWKNHSTFFVA